MSYPYFIENINTDPWGNTKEIWRLMAWTMDMLLDSTTKVTTITADKRPAVTAPKNMAMHMKMLVNHTTRGILHESASLSGS